MTDRPEAVPGSTKPYLVRAIFDWCLDEGLTPQIMVDAGIDGVAVPPGYVNEGKIVLNLHPDSVRQLELGNEYLMFSARFAGRAEEICVPVEAVMAVYARENGQGIVFQADGSGVTPPPSPGTAKDRDGPKEKSTKSEAEAHGATRPGSHLKVIK